MSSRQSVALTQNMLYFDLILQHYLHLWSSVDTANLCFSVNHILHVVHPALSRTNTFPLSSLSVLVQRAASARFTPQTHLSGNITWVYIIKPSNKTNNNMQQ